MRPLIGLPLSGSVPPVAARGSSHGARAADIVLARMRWGRQSRWPRARIVDGSPDAYSTMAGRTIRLLIAYDGTGFRGWAAQRDRSIRTVEGAICDVLTDVLVRPADPLRGRARTDAGVHARGQVASFRVADRTEVPRIRRALNSRLAPEVVVIAAEEAPEGFDARFSATAREYRYRVDVGDAPDPFTSRFVWHHPCAPDLRAMRTAARHLTGEHDFTSFCRHPGAGRPTVRYLQRASVSRSGDRVELGFRANAFLHQMVRAITGDPARRRRREGRSRRDPRRSRGSRSRGGPPVGAPARLDPRACRLRRQRSTPSRSRGPSALTARIAAGSLVCRPGAFLADLHVYEDLLSEA